MAKALFLKGKYHHFPLSYSDKVIRLIPNTEEEAHALKKIGHQLKVRECPLITVFIMCSQGYAGWS